MPVYGQGKQNTQQLVGQQQETFPGEKGTDEINDVRQSRLVLLEGIDNAILRLDQVKTGHNNRRVQYNSHRLSYSRQIN